MHRVAELQPYLPTVPGTTLRGRAGTVPIRGGISNSVPNDECRAAIASMRHGAWTEALMLGSGETAQSATDRCRRLVRLVDEVARGSAGPATEPMITALPRVAG